MAFNYNNKLLRVKFATKSLLQEISFDWSADKEFNELASKDIDSEFSPSKKTYSLSGEAYVANDAAGTQQDIAAMMTWFEDDSLKAFEIGDSVVGNIQLSGTAYMKGYAFKSEVNGVATYSITLQVSGTVTNALTA